MFTVRWEDEMHRELSTRTLVLLAYLWIIAFWIGFGLLVAWALA